MTNPNQDPAGPPPSDSPAPRPPMRLSLGDLLVLLGALLVFGFSFAPFVEYSQAARESLFALVTGVSLSFNAWSLQTFMVPLTTFVVAAALLAIAAVVVRFVQRRDPQLLGFRLRQVEVGLAAFAFLVLLGLIASDKHVIFGARRIADVDSEFDPAEVTIDTGWGAVLMLIGAILMLVGALLNHFSIGPAMSLRRVGSSGPPDVAPEPGQQPPPDQEPPSPPGGWRGSAPPPPGS